MREGNGAPRARFARLVIVTATCAGLAACSSSGSGTVETAEINTKTKFSSAAYGVKASPRVTTSRTVKKGGGRYMVGKPYKIAGRWFTPAEDPDYDTVGKASWYGPNFHGRKTANGEIYDQYHLSAAHPTLPLPSYARVTNQENGHSVIVRINDRGPFHGGRIIDVSSKAADLLDMKRRGTAKVRVEYIGKAQMDGRDMPFLMASYRPGGAGPSSAPEGQIASGVMVAMNDSPPAAIAPSGDLPGVGAAPAIRTALVAERETATPALAGIDDAVLPEVGPVLQDRPTVAPGTVAPVADQPSGEPDYRLAAAYGPVDYASARVASAAAAFDALVAGPQLTPEDIARSVRRPR